MSNGAGWQDYVSPDGGWQDYTPQKPPLKQQVAQQPKGLWEQVKNAFRPRSYSQESGFVGGNPQEMPGFTEGRGLREALSDYDVASFGSMGRGAADLARGNLARGGHEILSGGMNALTPLTPLVAPAAPAALARGIVGGSAGGYLARRGAEAFGASPDLTDLAGDVGGIAGGYAGAKLTTPVATAPVRYGARLAESLANSKLRPLAKIMTPADEALSAKVRVPGRDFGLPGRAAPPAVYPNEGTPYPSATPEQLNPSLVSPSRTLPGMNPPEVIRPPAQPIPSRSGLMLPGGTEPQVPQSTPGSLLDAVRATPRFAQSAQAPATADTSMILPRMRSLAQQIEEQGPEPPPVYGRQLRINEQDVPAGTDLAPSLQESVIDANILKVLGKEKDDFGRGLVIGMQRLARAPELQGVSPDQFQAATNRLINSGRVENHGYGLAFKRR